MHEYKNAIKLTKQIEDKINNSDYTIADVMNSLLNVVGNYIIENCEEDKLYRAHNEFSERLKVKLNIKE